MGIHRLMSLLKEKCPKAIKEIDIKALTGYKLACDASMSIYQFLISTQGYNKGFGLSELTDKDGNLTGHLIGIFNRSIMMLEKGIRPVWVFDGKPPELKTTLLEKRKERKKEAEEKLKVAEEADNQEDIKKYAGQTVKITKTMIEDAKTMIRLLGLPVIEAPSEAEAQCTILAKKGIVYGVASEDMDCLTFGAPYLLRGFNNKDDPVVQIKLDEILKGMDITMDQFIDICILCGCDYSTNISNIGPVKAYNFIKEHKNIEEVIKYVEEENKNEKKKSKYLFDENTFLFKEAREAFINPVADNPSDLTVSNYNLTNNTNYNINIQITFNKPDAEKLKKFLVEEKGFSENRVESGLKRMEGGLQKSAQVRLDNFFTVKTTVTSTSGKPAQTSSKTTTKKKKK